MPAVTIVAAWINALTGVGPAMASGSQTYSGICADLPVAATKKSRQTSVTTPVGSKPACASIAPNDSVHTSCAAKPQNRTNTPSRNPASPIRLTMNAFLPASAFSGSVYQNPISRYEHKPTPSQPTNSSSRLSPSTSNSIAAVNRLRYAK